MNLKAGTSRLCVCGLILIFVNAYAQAVKINSVSVPSLHELKDDDDTITLECDFIVDSSDTGFVLKWLHNSVAIYQWIPSKKVPFALGSFKGRVDLNTTSSDNRLKSHSALIITKPLLSDSGTYTCNVQTFQGSDKMDSDLLIIDPADKIDFEYKIDQAEETVNLLCHVPNIFPMPEVKLLFEAGMREIESTENTEKIDGLYDVTLTRTLQKNEIDDESKISCEVRIPNSNYTKRHTITYDDPKYSATTKKTILGELTDAGANRPTNNENSAYGLKSSLVMMLLSVMLSYYRASH